MNKQTIILLIAIALFLIPTAGIVAHSYSVDKFDALKNEGFIAYNVAYLETVKNTPEIAPSPKVDEKPKTCSKCNGTKQVRSPDGITNISCPCGSGCKCVGMKGAVNKRTVLVFGAKWCGPCVLWHEKDEVNLKKNGWTFGEGKNIQVIDFDENPALVQKYNITSVPAYITLENGKEVYRVTGYVNGVGMGKVYDGKPLSATDRQ